MMVSYNSPTMTENWLAAYQHICHSRRNASPNASIWDLRFHWQRDGDEMLQQVLDGAYCLSPMQVVGKEGHPMWCALDAVVLKFLALELMPVMPAHRLCAHVKGHGGVFGSVGQVANWLRQGRATFVFRTDIRGFYENISKHSVVALADRYIQAPALRQLYLQYANYSVELGGLIHTPVKGICRGCALSPMTAATLLWEMDSHFEACCSADFFYSRYMDDFLFLSSRRWPLRRAISWLCAQFEVSGFCRHPEKTITGRTEQGFDWLGVWFSPDEYTISPRASAQFKARQEALRARYQQRNVPAQRLEEKLQMYRERWAIWREALLRQTESKASVM